jgi:hypothetical protein
MTSAVLELAEAPAAVEAPAELPAPWEPPEAPEPLPEALDPREALEVTEPRVPAMLLEPGDPVEPIERPESLELAGPAAKLDPADLSVALRGDVDREVDVDSGTRARVVPRALLRASRFVKNFRRG